MKNKSLNIILPVRIGDSVLSIPGIICLKQLNSKYNNYSTAKVFALPFIQKLLAPLNSFECHSLNNFAKIKSNLFPSDKALFMETTSKNLGFAAKETYGLTNPNKKCYKYDFEAEYLRFETVKDYLPEKLFSFLQEKYKLSFYSMSLFGFCLDAGYSEEQIIETFVFSPDIFSLENYSGYSNEKLNEKYVVACMEAGYGKKGNEMRYWGKENHFEMAKRMFEDYGVKSAFIGKDKEEALPDEDYFIDLRGEVDLYQLACVMKNSVAYIGNDTGPLHVANLMKKRSVSLYFKENTLTESSPIFPGLNIQVFQPQGIEEVYSKVQGIL